MYKNCSTSLMRVLILLSLSNKKNLNYTLSAVLRDQLGQRHIYNTIIITRLTAIAGVISNSRPTELNCINITMLHQHFGYYGKSTAYNNIIHSHDVWLLSNKKLCTWWSTDNVIQIIHSSNLYFWLPFDCHIQYKLLFLSVAKLTFPVVDKENIRKVIAMCKLMEKVPEVQKIVNKHIYIIIIISFIISWMALTTCV